MKRYIKILTLVFTLSFLWGCLEDPEVYKVIVKTDSTVEFVQGGVSLNGGIYTENEKYQPTIDSCGFCYGIEENPTLSNSVVKVKNSVVGDFNATLRSLNDGTRYYARAFAQNKYGVVYGEEVSFVSLTKPTVKTLSLSEDNENSQLIVECELESLGSGDITELGVCYSSEKKLPNKENGEYKLVSNIHKGKYTVSITVKPNTKYYVRAFASNLASVAYGNVKESKYIISFNSNGGNGEMNEMIVSPSRNMQLPLNSFTRVGYVFIGWNTKADASGLTYSDNQMVSISEDIILYAQWREDYVDLGLSSGTLWAKMNIGASSPEEYGDYFAWGEIETKSLFRWSTYRWCNGDDYEHNLTKYCMQEYEGRVDNKIILELADDAAHANWGGNWRMPSKAELEELCTECIWTETTINAINGYLVTSKTNDNSIFLPSAGYYDYISDYLQNEGSCGLYWSSSLRTDVSDYAFFMSTANHVISARERYNGRTVRPVLSANNIEKPELPAKYTITFYTNGGVGNLFSKSIGVGSFITLPTNKFTRTGYEFVGWNTSSDGTGISYTEGQTITPRGNISLYAQWKKKEYTITFNSNGGSGSMSSKTVSAGSTVSLPANSFIRSGYEFYGWNISSDGTGTSYIDGQIITPSGNITLYAQWKKIEIYYTISFNSNGGSGNMGSKTVSTGSSVTLPNSTFTRSGYEFIGWNTNSSGAGISYSNGQTITPSGDMTLYAQWKKKEVYYTITFDNNGGSGSMSSKTVSAGTSFYLPINTFTRSGYEFVGWNTNSYGTGTSYTDGQIITPSGNISLYAQWKKIEEEQEQVSGSHQGHDYVDLGLPSGTLWATCNVGATKAEEYGDYFAWGETESKDMFSWNTYKWCNGNDETMTKYCTSSSYGVVDNKRTLELSDDVAYAKWGGNWRMPTKSELDELKNSAYTIWIVTTKNGVSGCKVTSKLNGYSIFLPAVGTYSNSELSFPGERGDYWGRSLNTSRPDEAYILFFYPEGVSSGYVSRRLGKSVRPVMSR